MNYSRHNQSLKHKKNERVYNRAKIIESANEEGIKFTNEDIEQKIDKQYPELEGIKYFDSCDMYLDNNTEYNKQIERLKHRNNVTIVSGEKITKGSKFECATCKSTLIQYSVDQHLKTKMHLDNLEGKDKDKDKDNNITEDSTKSEDSIGYCNICNTRYNNKNKHYKTDDIKKMLNRKNLLMGSVEIKLMS